MENFELNPFKGEKGSTKKALQELLFGTIRQNTEQNTQSLKQDVEGTKTETPAQSSTGGQKMPGLTQRKLQAIRERKAREKKEQMDRMEAAAFQYLNSSDNLAKAAKVLQVEKTEFAQEWSKDIVAGMDRNDITMNLDNLALCIAQVELEGVYYDEPPVQGLELRILAEKAKLIGLINAHVPTELLRDLAMDLLKYIEKKYEKRILACKTERELDQTASEIVSEVEQDPYIQSTFDQLQYSQTLKSEVDKLMEKARHPVKTHGAMQVDLRIAREVLESKGRTFKNDDELRDHLYVRETNLDVGFTLLARGLDAYVESERGSRDHVVLDYNAGRFTSRNASFQNTLSELLMLSGDDALVQDGDLLIYDSDAQAIEAASQTEKVIRRLSRPNNWGFTDEEIRNMLLLEKQASFENTPLYKNVQALYEQRKGEPAPYAVVPNAKAQYAESNADYGSGAKSYMEVANRFYDRIRPQLES